jgi:hypothetical protein
VQTIRCRITIHSKIADIRKELKDNKVTYHTIGVKHGKLTSVDLLVPWQRTDPDMHNRDAAPEIGKGALLRSGC